MNSAAGIVGAMPIAILASCQTAQAAWTGVTREDKIDANTYRVVLYFDAPAKDDMQRDFWIFDRAELASRNGFDVIVGIPDPDPARRTGSADSAPSFVPAVADGPEDARIVQTRRKGSSRVSSPTYHYVTKYYVTGVIRMYMQSDALDATRALRTQSIIDALDASMKSGAKIAPPSRADVFSKARSVAPPASPSGV